MKIVLSTQWLRILVLFAVICWVLLIVKSKIFSSSDTSPVVKIVPPTILTPSNNKDHVVRVKPGPLKSEPHQRLPDALLVGAGKCGTDALITYLNTSETFVTNTLHNNYHELNYFNDKYDLGTQWYIEQMPAADADQILIEKCAPYLWNPSVPPRVYNTSKSMKIIMVLCDPVKRTVSLYTHKNSYKAEGAPDPLPPFTDLIQLTDGGELVEQTHSLLPQPLLKSSTYSTFVKQWLDYFPREQILFISGEDLTSSPLDEVSKVTSFLGKPNAVTSENVYFNETRGYYCFKANSGYKWCLDPSLKGRKHPALSADLISALQNHYKPYNDELKTLIGTDFGWPKYFGQKSR